MIKVLTEGCEPKLATKYSAAVDLFAAEDIVIGSGETAKVSLGVCIDQNWFDKLEFLTQNKDLAQYKSSHITRFMSSHYLQLMLRSSLGLKGLILPNGVGIIDMDYTGEICMIIHNPIKRYGNYPVLTDEVEISKGDKIAQIMLCEHKSYLLGYSSDVERSGGFGSSGA